MRGRGPGNACTAGVSIAPSKNNISQSRGFENAFRVGKSNRLIKALLNGLAVAILQQLPLVTLERLARHKIRCRQTTLVYFENAAGNLRPLSGNGLTTRSSADEKGCCLPAVTRTRRVKRSRSGMLGQCGHRVPPMFRYVKTGGNDVGPKVGNNGRLLG